jgi:hypothetical protein
MGRVRKYETPDPGNHAITMTRATKILVANCLPPVSNWNNYKNIGRYHACLQSN